MTANVKCTVEQRSHTYEIDITYRLALIHSTCSSSPQFELLIIYTNYLAPRSFSNTRPLRQIEKHLFCWNWAAWLLRSSSLHPPKIDVNKPT